MPKKTTAEPTAKPKRPKGMPKDDIMNNNTYEPTITCCLCGIIEKSRGRNPDPLCRDVPNGRCCEACDHVVIRVRIILGNYLDERKNNIATK
ncbi:MAG: hypothetical protein C0467_23255 [Planctomycetaceae bacterium]|nr:hypothetical protein [Planctomycetaceae bacterium]